MSYNNVFIIAHEYESLRLPEILLNMFFLNDINEINSFSFPSVEDSG